MDFWVWERKKIRLTSIVQNFDFYQPNMIATELNEKGNKIFKLGSICKMNGFDIGKDIHTAAGDVKGTINLFFVKKKIQSF